MSINQIHVLLGSEGTVTRVSLGDIHFPLPFKFQASNNLLEYLAAVITPWMGIIMEHLREGDCALLMTDSTTSEGWLRKSNF